MSTLSPGLMRTRRISTAATPTSLAIRTWFASSCQPQRFFANVAKLSFNSGIAPRYPVSERSIMSRSEALIGSAIGKSISATGSGRTSDGKPRHFSLLRWRRSAKLGTTTLSDMPLVCHGIFHGNSVRTLLTLMFCQAPGGISHN